MNKKEIIYSFFCNRKAVLATMHHKEKVMAPVIEEALGIKVVVPENFNTDLYGTFTREIERKGNQLEAARYKALEALSLTGETLAISSEGSFGPHPIVPFLPYNREIVVLIDKEKNIEIIGEASTTETNYGEKVIKTFEEAYQFALSAGFPQHGMIIRGKGSGNATDKIIKGITTKDALEEAFNYIVKVTDKEEITIETDMRGMYNPTRMKNIEAATKDLVNKIYNMCPSCCWPGFTLTEVKKGLPCSWCGLPTDLPRGEVYTCRKCRATEEKLYPNGKEKADPGQCHFCNP